MSRFRVKLPFRRVECCDCRFERDQALIELAMLKVQIGLDQARRGELSEGPEGTP